MLTHPTLSHFRSALFASLPLISCALHFPLILFITSTAQGSKYRNFSRQGLISRNWSSVSRRLAAPPYLFHVANWLSSPFRIRTSGAVNILDRLFTIIYVTRIENFSLLRNSSRIHRTLQVLLYILSVIERVCIIARYSTNHYTFLRVTLNWFD
jgi:hypothetical protein